MSPRSNKKNQHLVSGQLQKTLHLDGLLTRARDMVTWYWSADTLFWQVSVDHNMDVQHQRSTNQGFMSLCQPVIWSMAAMLRDSVVVVVVRICPRAIPLAMITMRKSTYGFPFVSHMRMGLRLAALRATGAPQLYNYILFVTGFCCFCFVTV